MRPEEIILGEESKRGKRLQCWTEREKSWVTNGIEAINGDQYPPGMHRGMPDSLQLPKNRAPAKSVSFTWPLALVQIEVINIGKE